MHELYVSYTREERRLSGMVFSSQEAVTFVIVD
jgi:hypothetical protein